MVNRRMTKGIMVMKTWLYRMVDMGKFSDEDFVSQNWKIRICLPMKVLNCPHDRD